MRAEFDRFVQGFIERLRTSKTYARSAEKLKRDFLARPEIRGLAGSFWESLRLLCETVRPALV